MLKYIRGVKRDFSTVNSLVKTGRGLQKGVGTSKQKLIIFGITLAAAVAVKVGKSLPKVARGISKSIKGKKRRVGRGTEVPQQKEGNVKENIVDEVEKKDKEQGEKGLEDENVGTREPLLQGVSEVRPKKVNKLKEVYEKGEEYIKGLVGKDSLQGDALRLVGQVVELCNKFNEESGSLNVKYTLEGDELHLQIEGGTLIVGEGGINSMAGGDYYKKGVMSRDAGILRLLVDYPKNYKNLLVGIVMAYEMDLYEGLDYNGILDGERKKKEEINKYDIEVVR